MKNISVLRLAHGHMKEINHNVTHQQSSKSNTISTIMAEKQYQSSPSRSVNPEDYGIRRISSSEFWAITPPAYDETVAIEAEKPAVRPPVQPKKRRQTGYLGGEAIRADYAPQMPVSSNCSNTAPRWTSNPFLQTFSTKPTAATDTASTATDTTDTPDTPNAATNTASTAKPIKGSRTRKQKRKSWDEDDLEHLKQVPSWVLRDDSLDYRKVRCPVPNPPYCQLVGGQLCEKCRMCSKHCSCAGQPA